VTSALSSTATFLKKERHNDDMPVTIEGIKTRVKFSGVFDFRDLYRMVRDYLQDKGYVQGDSWKYMENYYSEKHSSNPKEGNTVWIWWRTFKKGDEGSTFYTQHIDIDFHARFLKDTEMVIDGEKRRLQKGELEILFSAYLNVDPDNKWSSHWLLKGFLDMYIRRIWRKRREAVKWTTIGDCMFMQSAVKDYFNIKKYYGAQKEMFYPQFGYKMNG